MSDRNDAHNEQYAQYETLCLTLKELRTEAIDARTQSGVEEIWKGDEEYYDGIDEHNREEKMLKPSSSDGRVYREKKSKKTGSTVFYNITARYVDAATAHVADKLLPSDQPNYGIFPTPVPDLIVKLKSNAPAVDENGQPMLMPVNDEMGNPVDQPHVVNGQPMLDSNTGQPVMIPATKPATEADIAAEQIKQVEEACEKASKQIDDWLSECGSLAHNRQVIHDSGKIGTGVLKGPFAELVKKRAIVDGKMVYEQVIVPKNRRISVWNLYPDPSCGEDIHRGKFIFEKDEINSRLLGELKKDPSYLSDALDKVINEGPKDSKTGNVKRDKNYKKNDKEVFDIWYFHGYLSSKDLEACGHKFSDEEDAGEEGNELEELGLISAVDDVVDAVQDEVSEVPDEYTQDQELDIQAQPKRDENKQYPVIVVMVNDCIIKVTEALFDSGRFPYQVMRWQKKPGCWHGTGVGRVIRTQQDGVNASVRMLMDNSGVSARPIPVINRKMLEPADGKSYVLGPGSVFYTTENFENDDIRKAVTWILAPSNQAELMNNIQFWMRSAEEVSGLPQLLQGQGSEVQQTRGEVQILNNNGNAMLRRITNAYDDDVTKHNISGFYEWLLIHGDDDSAKGDFTVTARGSSVLIERDMKSNILSQLLPASLNPAYGLDPELIMEELLLGQRLDAPKLKLSEAKKKEMAQRQPPPDPRVQVAQINAEAKLKLEELDDKDAADHAEATARLELQRQNFDTQQAELNRALVQWQKNVDAQIAAAQLSGEQAMNMEELKVSLTKEAAKLRTQMQLAGKTTSPQVATPSVEPRGRAPNGQAFQR